MSRNLGTKKPKIKTAYNIFHNFVNRIIRHINGTIYI